MEEAQGNGKQDFNPRSPHGERPTRAHGGWRTSYFNPRSPHGERQSQQPVELRLSYFNPRSPHGERHVLWCRLVIRQDFNPRSPHGERLQRDYHGALDIVFQSTLPARGATLQTAADFQDSRNFNPRSPHGERQYAGGTKACARCISIHAPRTGSDVISGVMVPRS